MHQKRLLRVFLTLLNSRENILVNFWSKTCPSNFVRYSTQMKLTSLSSESTRFISFGIRSFVGGEGAQPVWPYVVYLTFQYLAIYIDQNLPNWIKNLPKYVQSFLNNTQKLTKHLIELPKLQNFAKFQSHLPTTFPFISLLLLWVWRSGLVLR